MYIISHRGYYNNNRFLGIFCSEMRWSEIDLLWTGTEWILCHDFFQKKIFRFHDSLKDFLPYLRHRHHDWKILFDIKWDAIYNRDHDDTQALASLSSLLSKHVDKDMWLQFSYSHHIDIANDDAVLSKFPVGLLICDEISFRSDIAFIDVDVSRCREAWIHAIKHTYPDIRIIGFTCHTPRDIKLYKHLFPYLYGLVCDNPR